MKTTGSKSLIFREKVDYFHRILCICSETPLHLYFVLHRNKYAILFYIYLGTGGGGGDLALQYYAAETICM
jgi:hypothetical protein